MGYETTSRTLEREGRSSARRRNLTANPQPREPSSFGKLPAKGLPLPQGVGWNAFTALLTTFGRMSPQVGVVLWILETVQRQRPPSATTLSRDLHVRRTTAAHILFPKNAAGERISGWVQWARYVTGAGGVWSEVTQTPVVTQIRKELREQSGSGENLPNPLTARVIEDANDKNGSSY